MVRDRRDRRLFYRLRYLIIHTGHCSLGSSRLATAKH